MEILILIIVLILVIITVPFMLCGLVLFFDWLNIFDD